MLKRRIFLECVVVLRLWSNRCVVVFLVWFEVKVVVYLLAMVIGCCCCCGEVFGAFNFSF